MNTPSLNNHNDIKNKFDELLKFNNEKEEVEHEATMLSFQFISAFNTLMGTTVSKKDIADAIGTSKSYITQVFNGSKLLNLETIIKIQKALNANIKISLITNDAETGLSVKANKKLAGVQIPSLHKNEKQANRKRENALSMPLHTTSQKAGRKAV